MDYRVKKGIVRFIDKIGRKAVILMLFFGEWHGFIGFAVLAWEITPAGCRGRILAVHEPFLQV